MTQDEFDTHKAWLDNEFELAKQRLDDTLNQPEQQVGKHHTNHQVAKITYTRRVKYLNKRLDELKSIVISDKPDIEPAIVEQIAKLEEQREHEIAQSDASRHPHIRRKYSMQINKLKTYGKTHVTQPRQQYVIDYDNVPAEVLEHVKALESERDALIASTPFERFSRCATSHSRIKRQYNIRISCLIKYGVDSTNKLPDKIAKINATKFKHWGPAMQNMQKAHATLRERYGVEHALQLPQASARLTSNINMSWQWDLKHSCNLDFVTEHPIENLLYDLRKDAVVIEINPTVTHNATKGFGYITGHSVDNDAKPAYAHKFKTDVAARNGYRCITIFDWDCRYDMLLHIRDVINKTEQLKTDDVIELDLSKEDPRLYPNYEVVKTWVQCHLYNIKTHEHIIRTSSIDVDSLIASGFVEVYDCGHALLKKIEK